MKNQRGIVIALSLAVVAFITTLGTSFLMRSLSEDRLGLRHAARQGAFFLAEGGADHAISNLRSNNTDNIPVTTLPTGTYWAEISSLGNRRYQATVHGLSGSEQRNRSDQCQMLVVVPNDRMSKSAHISDA